MNVRETVDRFVAAVKADDEEAGAAAIAELATLVITDLHRIADAMEALAKAPRAA